MSAARPPRPTRAAAVRVLALAAALIAGLPAASPALAAPTPPQDAPSARPARPRILAPLNQATAVGPTEIRVDPGAPASSIEHVEIRVADDVVARLEAPPWTATFDAGEGERGWAIEVVVVLRDGRTFRASSRTSPLRIGDYAGVDLVNVYALVRRPNGDYVTGMTADDFRVLEDGRPQRIDRFSAERKPLRVAIVLDTSQTMDGRKLEKAKRAAGEFLEILGGQDEGLVVTFDNRVRVAQDITRDKAELLRAVESAEAGGGTALYDAIFRSARRLGDFDGRRVLILLSDGRDEAQNGLEPGSLHTLEEALVEALRNEAMIFSIGLGRGLEDELDFYRRRTLGSILEQMAAQTGGRSLLSSGVGELRRSFRDIAEDLRNQYSIAYTSDNERDDGSWREIELLVGDRDLEVIHRRGYYAPRREPVGGSGATP